MYRAGHAGVARRAGQCLMRSGWRKGVAWYGGVMSQYLKGIHFYISDTGGHNCCYSWGNVDHTLCGESILPATISHGCILSPSSKSSTFNCLDY